MAQFDLTKRRVRLKTQTYLDVWHLKNLIEPGDLVTAKTLRTIFIEREGRREKAGRRLVTLTLRVERVELYPALRRLRLKGRIVTAPEDVPRGSYHTIQVGVGDRLTLEKREWRPEHIHRLEWARIRIEPASSAQLRKFFTHLARADGLAVYGFERVRVAALAGAVELLLVPEEKLTQSTIEGVAREVRMRRGKVGLVYPKEQLGKRFCQMCDVGAILRFVV